MHNFFFALSIALACFASVGGIATLCGVFAETCGWDRQRAVYALATIWQWIFASVMIGLANVLGS